MKLGKVVGELRDMLAEEASVDPFGAPQPWGDDGPGPPSCPGDPAEEVEAEILAFCEITYRWDKAIWVSGEWVWSSTGEPVSTATHWLPTPPKPGDEVKTSAFTCPTCGGHDPSRVVTDLRREWEECDNHVRDEVIPVILDGLAHCAVPAGRDILAESASKFLPSFPRAWTALGVGVGDVLGISGKEGGAE